MEKAKQNKIAKFVMYVAMAIVAIALSIGVVFRPGTARAGELCDSITIETMKRHTPVPQADKIPNKTIRYDFSYIAYLLPNERLHHGKESRSSINYLRFFKGQHYA